mgnify:CR=1 FL=1
MPRITRNADGAEVLKSRMGEDPLAPERLYRKLFELEEVQLTFDEAALRADPVHYRVMRDRVVIVPAADLDEPYAAALVATSRFADPPRPGRVGHASERGVTTILSPVRAAAAVKAAAVWSSG